MCIRDRSIDPLDRANDGAGAVDDQPGATPQPNRLRRLRALWRPPHGRWAPAPPEGRETDCGVVAAHLRAGKARHSLVSRTNLPWFDQAISGRSGDACVTRDDLPGPLRAGPRRLASRGADGAAHRTVPAQSPEHRPGPPESVRRSHDHDRRPAAGIEDRAIPGHWEGDLITGTANKSAIGTLVERTTRAVMLVHLPDSHTAEAVRDGLVAVIGTLPEHLRGSLTWDQGSEMATHKSFSIATDM